MYRLSMTRKSKIRDEIDLARKLGGTLTPSMTIEEFYNKVVCKAILDYAIEYKGFSYFFEIYPYDEKMHTPEIS